MSDAIIRIESKLAHLEFALETLNGVVTHQQQQLERLEAGYRALSTRLASAVQDRRSDSEDVESEKPPHY